MFIRYALDDAMAFMADLWVRPTSKPVLAVVSGVAAGVAVFGVLSGNF